MILDLKEYSLLQLYQMLNQRKKRLEEFRAEEPSTKREHRREHELWVALCQAQLEDIQRIRFAIIEKREKMGLP